MNRRASIIVLLALSAVIYLGTAAWPALLDSTDAGHAVAAREMAETGNWAVLHINGIRYLEKPPLHYWLVAASYKVFGVSAFSTRLPVALAMIGLVMMIYLFGRTWFGEREGFYAGLVMCTAPGAFLFTRIMIPEAIYTLEFTILFYLFLRAWTGTLPPRVGYWGAAVMLGLGALTRSLVGFVFPLAILFLFVLALGQWKRLRDLPLISSAVIFLAVALPWHLIAGLTTPRFFWFYFMNEQVLRALGMRYPHDYEAVPLLVWLGAHVIWFFPWIVFLPYALREFPRLRTWRSGLDASAQARLLLFLWAGFTLLFFSWTKSRLEYYSFSAWPAFALLLGLGLARAEEKRAVWLPRLQAGVAVIGLLIAAALGGLLWVSRSIHSTDDITSLLRKNPESFYRIAMADFFDLTPQSFANLRYQALTAMVLLLSGLGAAWLLRRRRQALGATMAMALTVAGFIFCANWSLGVFEPHLSSQPLVKELQKYVHPSDQLVLYGEFDNASSVAFYTGRQLLIFNGRYNGLEFGSYYPDAPKIFLDDHSFPSLWNGPERVFLIVPPQEQSEALVRLPRNTTYLLTEVGGRAIYSNRQITTGQMTLAQIDALNSRPKPAPSTVSTDGDSPRLKQKRG